MRTAISILSLVLSALLQGCASTGPGRVSADRNLGFVVLPVVAQSEARPRDRVTVRLEIYPADDREVMVPDPEYLSLFFENIDSLDALVCLGPFVLDGPPPKAPARTIRLQPHKVISAELIFEVPPDASGTFLIREYWYGAVYAALRVSQK